MDKPELLSEIQNGLPALSEMPQALTRLGSWTAATPGKSDTRLVCKTVPPVVALAGCRRGAHADRHQGGGRHQRDDGEQWFGQPCKARQLSFHVVPPCLRGGFGLVVCETCRRALDETSGSAQS